MKITKQQLKRIIKEEKAKLLKEEPSDYYKDYKSGSISYEEYQQMVKDYERRTGDGPSMGSSYASSPRKTSYVGANANKEQIEALETALQIKKSNFLSSVLDQLKKGRGLSGKQKSIVKKILQKSDPSAVALFESRSTMKVTKRQLRRIIKEEKAKVLLENAIMGLVKKYAAAGTPEVEQLKKAKQDPAYQDFSDAEKSEFEIALEDYNEEMMGF